MPKYLFQASYTEEGLKGLLKEGGSSRVKAVEQTVSGMGGRLETMYFAFGDTDVFAVAELPDHATTTAFALVLSAAGTANVKTTVLLTPEEVDQAIKKSVDYRPPGY